MRYRRTILSPAQWFLTLRDLPSGEADQDTRRQVLDRWRQRWACPRDVELRDADRTVRLTLDNPAHASLLHDHLIRHGQATLTEATPVAELNWLGGHTHEVAVPLVTTRVAGPSPLRGCLPSVTNQHGYLPAGLEATWLYAKIHTHPERMDEIIAEHLPALFDHLDTEPSWWFVRYHSPHETHHLRLRIHTDRSHYALRAAEIGGWAQRLRQAGIMGRLVLDTYCPEIGRYGHGAAMEAAENVFAADSYAVAVALRHLPANTVHPIALTVANMVSITRGFLGDASETMNWLTARRVPTGLATNRMIADQAIHLAAEGALRDLPGWTGAMDRAWMTRAEALAIYRQRLRPDADKDAVLESLLHMHHNRAIGADPDSERMCRRLARQTALKWQAQQSS